MDNVIGFTFKARIYKLVALVGGFIAGLFFLPMMAAWDGGVGSFTQDFSPMNGMGWLLLAVFIIAGLLSSAISFLIVRNWEMTYVPEGYDMNQLW